MRTFLLLCLTMLVFPTWSNAELVWVDANGSIVATVLYWQFSSTPYMDGNGLIWSGLDPETAILKKPDITVSGGLFLQPDCTGPAYVEAVQPRNVFFIRNLLGCWVRRDDIPSQSVRFFYSDFGGRCTLVVANLRIVPESGLNQVSCEVHLVARPPLHVERR